MNFNIYHKFKYDIFNVALIDWFLEQFKKNGLLLRKCIEHETINIYKKTRMTTSISSEAFEKKPQKAKELKIIQKKTEKRTK